MTAVEAYLLPDQAATDTKQDLLLRISIRHDGGRPGKIQA
jgi:hypothetical protein